MPDPDRLSDPGSDSSEPFLQILLRYIDGDLGEEGASELNRRLRDSAESRDLFTAFFMRAQMIRELGEPERAAAALPGADAAGDIARAPASPGTGKPSRFHRLALASAAAAVLAVLLWLAFAPPGGGKSFATLVEVVDAAWEEGAPAIEKGARFDAGSIRLASGLAKVRFSNGAAVTLEGPADFEVVGDNRAQLRSGTLTATVPPEATGFQLDTPAVHITDYGTSFGIAVDEQGTTDVIVFEGEVQVELPREANAAARRRRVAHGAAIRAAAGAPAIREAPYDPEPFSRAWPVNAGVLRTSGMVRFAPPGPLESLLEYEDDEHLVILPERRSIRLERRTRVNITEPGKYPECGAGKQSRIQAGTRVDSYLIQFKPVRRETRQRLVGIATFERPIAGLITGTKLLQATDGPLGGHPSPLVAPGRGLEPGGRGGDVIILTDDRLTLVLDLQVSGPREDQIRVLVEAAEVERGYLGFWGTGEQP